MFKKKGTLTADEVSGCPVGFKCHAGVPGIAPAILSVPGKLYAVGGYDGAACQCLSTVEQYNPETNEWTYVADMSTRRSGAGIVSRTGIQNFT